METREVIDWIGAQPRERAAGEVEAFYTRSPFPGYAPDDDAATLLARSRRSAFLAALDAALAPGARVLDAGCGTGQLAAFLALAGPRRVVVGVDGCRASLELASAFRARAAIENLTLVRADLFGLPAELPHEGPGFDAVVCRGVVHHTPDPERATRAIAARVCLGGILVLGFYERFGRLFHRGRRALARFVGAPIAGLDPILRRADVDLDKRRVWIDDQYLHPLEHILSLREVAGWLAEEGFETLRTVPPTASADVLLSPAPASSPMAAALRRAFGGVVDPDAGLVCVIARRAH